MCLGGMLASDVLTLPEAIQMEVRKFFNRLEDWLAQLLLQGIASKDFRFAGNAKQSRIYSFCIRRIIIIS